MVEMMGFGEMEMVGGMLAVPLKLTTTLLTLLKIVEVALYGRGGSKPVFQPEAIPRKKSVQGAKGNKGRIT